MSDGREIVYYDEVDRGPRVYADPRDLAPGVSRCDLRYDPLLDDWVAIATHRQTRTFLPSADACPLCPARPGRPTEVPAPDYDVAVFENRFPAFAGEHGRCEVVCFTADHDRSFGELPPARVRLVVDVWADRTAELGRLEAVEQVFCFENRGVEVGVTLDHPHGQIYGYPFVPALSRRRLDSARRHRERTGGDLYAEVLAEERTGPRLVVTGERWTAFVPAFARWPVEVHLYPHRAVPDLPALDDEERDDLARVYPDVLRRLDRLYDAPLPYMACWHQAPVRVDRELARLHLEVLSPRRSADRLKFLAGSESAMGAFVGDVLPEDVAARLRELG